MTNEEFCELYTAFNGEPLTNINQLKKDTYDGESLKDFVEFCIEQREKPINNKIYERNSNDKSSI